MSKTYLTAGQFAKLARTTKRTVLWYDKMGILSPIAVADNGYRAYAPRQILDFQIISLLRQLDFSLEEIQQHVKGGQSLMSLFGIKKEAIALQILKLQGMMQDMETYYDNLAVTSLLVKPDIRSIPGFEIYYSATIAPYASIRDLCAQLASQFASVPDNATFLTIFQTDEYNPQAAAMKIGVVKQPGMHLHDNATEVQVVTISSYDALVHKHRGDGSLLSLLWVELGKYRRAHHLSSPQHLDFYELEFYHAGSLNGPESDDRIEFEMHLPVSIVKNNA